MRLRIFITALLISLVGTASAQTWHQGRTGTYVATTDMGDAGVRETIGLFQQEQSIVAQVLHKRGITTPTTINLVPVKDAESLTRTMAGFPATSLPISFAGVERQSVIFKYPSQLEDAQRAVALTLLEVNYPRTPKWFDAGFARYIGSMKIEKEEIVLGLAPTEKPHEGWARISEVMTKDAVDNPVWQHESWLLVHWIISNSRLDDAGKFFYLTMNQQVPVQEALQQSFGTNFKDLDADVRAYEAEVKIHVQRLPVTNVADKSLINVSKLNATDAQIAIANVMLDDHDDSTALPEAMKTLSGIMHNVPENAAVHRALAYGYFEQRDLINATEHARRAIALKDADPSMHYIMGVSLNGGDTATVRVTNAEMKLRSPLNAAILMDSNYAPAFELRGLAELAGDKNDAALKDLGHAAALRPRDDNYLLQLGNGQAATGDWDNARILFTMLKNSPDSEVASQATELLKTGKRLKKEEKHWSEQGIASGTYQDMTDPKWKPKEGEAPAQDEPEKPAAGPDTRKTLFLDGMLVSVDCSEDPGAKLLVNVKGKIWKLKIADRRDVVLIGPEDHFSCTWKSLHVHVNYKDSGGNTGDVVSVETR